MALRSIKTAVKPKALTREKLYCRACSTDDDPIPASEFRGDVVGGLLYLECTVCRGDIAPYYTKEAVEALVAEALQAVSADESAR